MEVPSPRGLWGRDSPGLFPDSSPTSCVLLARSLSQLQKGSNTCLQEGDLGTLLLKVGPTPLVLLREGCRVPLRVSSGQQWVRGTQGSWATEANGVSGTVQGLALWAPPAPLGSLFLKSTLLSAKGSADWLPCSR